MNSLEDSEVTGDGNSKLLLKILNSINGLSRDLDSCFDKLAHELATEPEINITGYGSYEDGVTNRGKRHL